MPAKKKPEKKKLPPPEELAKLSVFAEHILKVDAYDWQKRVWDDVEPKNCRVALRAANGSGKTSKIAAVIAAWNGMTAVGSTTVVTSGVMRQVREQFWPALKRLVEPFIDEWKIEITMQTMTFNREVVWADGVKRPMNSRIVCFTATDTFKFEGFHRTGDGDNLLVIADEAKTPNDDIFHAIERMQPSRFLMQSSPGPAQGAFYNAWNSEKALWKTHIIQAKDCPHLVKLVVRLKDGSVIPWIDSVIMKYGPNAPITKSMVYADWMSDEGELLVCPLHWYERCFEHPPEKIGTQRALGVDVAAGGDENVVAYREGNEVRIMETWRDKDTFQSAIKVSTIIKRLGLKGEDVFLDVGGLGIGFADTLAQIGIEVNRIQFGGRAYEADHYLNRGTEMWVQAGKEIEASRVRLPDNDELKSQLTTRRYIYKSAKIRLETKEEMRARGLKSPDKADALVMAMVGKEALDELSGITPYGESPMEKLLQAFGEQMDEEGSPIRGIDCGS